MSDTILKIICLTAALLYAFAFMFSFGKAKKFSVISHILWYTGIAVNAVIIGYNWFKNGYVPFVSMYQVLTFLSLTFSLVYVYIRYMHNGAFMKRYFIAMPSVIMIGVTFMIKPDAIWTFPPALQSVYFVPHVFAYMISYTLTAVAALLCIINFRKKSSEYDNGVYNLVCTAYPFMTAGLLLGALWANACWGEYWQWDIKEIWALVTWLSLAIYLHFRRHPKLQKFAKYFVPLALVFTIITLIGVNMMNGTSAHSY